MIGQSQGASDGRRAGTGDPHAGTSSELDQSEWRPDGALRRVGVSIVQLLHFRKAIAP